MFFLWRGRGPGRKGEAAAFAGELVLWERLGSQCGAGAIAGSLSSEGRPSAGPSVAACGAREGLPRPKLEPKLGGGGLGGESAPG